MSAAIKKPSHSHPRGGKAEGAAEPFPEGTGRAGRVGETLSEFMARTKNLPPLTWLIDELIPSIGQVWIIAMGGSGKTWCGFIIAKCAALRGRDVFLVEEEHHERGLHDRIVNMDFGAASERVRLWHRKGLKVGNALFDQLVDEVRSAQEPVVVLDCFAQVFSGKENEADDAARFNDGLKRLVTANSDALVVVLHHTSKGSERAEGAMAYAGRGSSAFYGAADLELRLRKLPATAGTLRFGLEMTKAREFEQSGTKNVTLTLGTGRVSFETAVSQSRGSPEEKVLEVLTDADEPLTKDAVSQQVKRRRDDVGKAIDALVQSGRVRREGKGFVAVYDPESSP